MATTSLSFYDVVDADTLGDPNPFRLTNNEFTSRDACFTWLWSHEEDLRNTVTDEVINGVAVRETQIPAQFLVVGAGSARSKREVPCYLSFGARIMAETEHFYIIGVPTEHARYTSQRLGSGMHYTNVLDSLESATKHAEELEHKLYGPLTTP